MMRKWSTVRGVWKYLRCDRSFKGTGWRMQRDGRCPPSVEDHLASLLRGASVGQEKAPGTLDLKESDMKDVDRKEVKGVG